MSHLPISDGRRCVKVPVSRLFSAAHHQVPDHLVEVEPVDLLAVPRVRLLVAPEDVHAVVDDARRVAVPLGRDVPRHRGAAPGPGLGVEAVDDVAGRLVVAAAEQVNVGAVGANLP